MGTKLETSGVDVFSVLLDLLGDNHDVEEQENAIFLESPSSRGKGSGTSSDEDAIVVDLFLQIWPKSAICVMQILRAHTCKRARGLIFLPFYQNQDFIGVC